MTQATVNGATLHVETLGPPDGAPLAILHGGPGLGDCRDQLRDYGPLQDEFRLLFYDARGSGRSEERPPYTHEQWAADVDELTRQQGFDRFGLLGHSYGGIVAMEYVVRHPERLTHLILVDTTPATVENEESIRRALAAGLPGIEEGWLRKLFEGRVDSNEEMRGMWEALLPLYFEGEFDPALPKQMADRTFFHYATHNFAFSVNNPSYDVRGRLGDVDVPTLVICGANDWITPLTTSKEIASLIPGSLLEVFEHSGHMPMIEENEKFVAVVRDFLRQPPR
ncbi:MAG TPA: alpha/beta fold hydrolase [Gaiellaceae bacterium]